MGGIRSVGASGGARGQGGKGVLGFLRGFKRVIIGWDIMNLGNFETFRKCWNLNSYLLKSL